MAENSRPAATALQDTQFLSAASRWRALAQNLILTQPSRITPRAFNFFANASLRFSALAAVSTAA